MHAARSNWYLLAAMVAGSVAVGVALWLVPGPMWWRSYELGALTTLTVVAVAWIVYVASGSHGRQLGRMGEEATVRTIGNRRQRRRGWQVVNGLYFDGHGDVDHVLVGPGGVFAVESKWLSQLCTIGDSEITGVVGREPLAQARAGAKKIELRLRHGRERLRDTCVKPVVILWGPGAPGMPGGYREVRGVLVCEGRRSRSWIRQLDRQLLPAITIEVITEALGSQRDRQIDQWARTG